jgi:oligosaccharide reducing-end xylanase
VADVEPNHSLPFSESEVNLKSIRKDSISALGIAVLLLMAASCNALSAQEPIPHSSDGSGAYATGHYRNLFAETGHSKREGSHKIKSAYRQLFHGDPQTQAIFFWTGKNANGRLAYITDWNSHDVRTEGMSYGMMIAVQLNHRKEFNALWNWAKTYMYIGDPNHPSYGYFSWSCKTDGTPNEETAAPDGEEYFVMSLYFAANRWGTGKGIYDYKHEADELLSNMRHRKEKTGPTNFGIRTVVAEVNKEHKMIRFVPSTTRGDFTDPSYHLPAFYELWARWGPAEDRGFWAGASEASREFFPKTVHPQTGLAPVYANFDGTPHANRFPQSAMFGYDSWRAESNWSVDWSWWQKAAVEQELSDRIQSFFWAQGIATYGEVYTLDGKVVQAQHSPGLVATNAAASLAAMNPHAKDFVEALWNTPVPSGQLRYYDGMLYLMSLMHCGGEFRIWKPKH